MRALGLLTVLLISGPAIAQPPEGAAGRNFRKHAGGQNTGVRSEFRETGEF